MAEKDSIDGKRATTAPAFLFGPTDEDGKALLMVRPGIDAVDALEQASCLLDCLDGQLGELAAGCDRKDTARALWGMTYSLQTVKAIVDAAVSGLLAAQAPRSA